MGFYVDDNGNQKKVLSVVRTIETGEIVVDSELSLTSENPVQNKVITRELNKKVDQNGKVAFADNLTPYSETSGANDTTPFVFQSSGGESDVGKVAYLKALRGNSVAFNQLINNTSQKADAGRLTLSSSSGTTLTYTCDTSTNFRYGQIVANIINGHKYFYKINANLTSAGSCTIRLFDSSYNEIALNISVSVVVGENKFSGIITATGNATNGSLSLYNAPSNQGDSVSFSDWELIDLTLMFGAGKEPTSVEEFNRLFPKSYYDYNAGELMSCKSNGYKIVGYNAFDEELEQGNINPANGQNISGHQERSKNYIKVIAGQNYTFEYQRNAISGSTYFYLYEYDQNKNYIGQTIAGAFTDIVAITLTNETHYIRFKLYNSNDFGGIEPTQNVLQCCLHLAWDNSKTGYEEHYEKTYPLPNVELRSAGEAYDEITPNGTKITRIGVVDLGTLTYTKVSNDFFATISGIKAPSATSEKPNVLCDKFVTHEQSSITSGQISVGTNGTLIIELITDMNATQFKTAMSGVMLYYELAEPIEETSEIYTYTEQTDIDDFGTQEFLYDNNTDIPIPQGNEFFYPVDYKAFVDSLGGREDIEYDASEIVSHTELSEYLTTISGYDATKIQTLKNINGTFTWVDDE